MTSTRSIDSLDDAWSALTRIAAGSALLGHIRDLSGVTLHRSALVTLRRLATDGPQLVSELAERVGVDVSTMSRLLRQLEREGLVERERQGGDQRCVQIQLTDAGIETDRRVSESRTVVLRQVIADWPQADRDAFAALLNRFTDGLSDYLEQPVAAA